MSKTHLEHPTQATACGAPAASCAGVGPVDFLVSTDRCKRCERVAVAEAAGRPVRRGVWLGLVPADDYVPPVLRGV